MNHLGLILPTLTLVASLSACVMQEIPPNTDGSVTPISRTLPLPRTEACTAFENHVWAQTVFDGDSSNSATLDPDSDGLACEELPAGIAPALWADRVPASATPATMTSVTDGDTIVVTVDGRREPVRLIGIDAQETGGPYRDVECFGPEASAFLQQILEGGGALFLEQDVEDRDRYGRLLRWVWLEDGDRIYLLNEAMVRAGYAERFRNTPNRRYLDQVRGAEAFAQRHQLGLWGACDVDRAGLLARPQP